MNGMILIIYLDGIFRRSTSHAIDCSDFRTPRNNLNHPIVSCFFVTVTPKAAEMKQ